MNTQKIAITVPKHLVVRIDRLCREKGLPRSRYISDILEEKTREEEKQRIRKAYDAVFSDADICREQLETAAWFDRAGDGAGEEW